MQSFIENNDTVYKNSIIQYPLCYANKGEDDDRNISLSLIQFFAMDYQIKKRTNEYDRHDKLHIDQSSYLPWNGLLLFILH